MFVFNPGSILQVELGQPERIRLRLWITEANVRVNIKSYFKVGCEHWLIPLSIAGVNRAFSDGYESSAHFLVYNTYGRKTFLGLELLYESLCP